MIICKTQLSNEELQQVNTLGGLCAAHDGAAPLLYRNILLQERATASNIFYLQNNNLIGFLSVYFFYVDACEISLMVHPNYRLQGIAKQLLHKILPILVTKQMRHLIFSAPVIMNPNWLKNYGFDYKSSQYTMQRLKKERVQIKNPRLSIKHATEVDIPTLDLIDSTCFESKSANMPARLKNLLVDPNYTILTAVYEHSIIGAVHLCWEEQNALLSDLAIMPKQQGLGLGGELLSYCINLAIDKGIAKITLHVENPKVINFYLHYDFKIIFANDFWSVGFENFFNCLFK